MISQSQLIAYIDIGRVRLFDLYNGKYGKKKGKIKKANRISHCYNYLPLLPSGPGGVQ